MLLAGQTAPVRCCGSKLSFKVSMVHSNRMQSEALFDFWPLREKKSKSPEQGNRNAPPPPALQPREVFERVFREIRPRSPIPPIEVRFCGFASANSFIQLKHGEIEARLSDILESAPVEVLESLAFILLSKLYRRPVPKDHASRYRRHLAHKEVRARIANVRQSRGRKELAGPRGEHYNLDQIFDEVNDRYFHGLMSRPALGWSLRRSRQTLGHYDPSHHTIILSRILDSPAVPRLAVEFVMYHEMLHIRFPAEHHHSSGRRCVHTAAFKAEEKQFDGYAEAKAILKAL